MSVIEYNVIKMMSLAHPGEVVAICQLDGTLKSWNSTLNMVNLMAPFNRGAVPQKLSLPHLGTLGQFDMGWQRLVGCLKIYVSLQNIGLFCRAILQKRPIFLSILLIVATP